MSLDANVTPTKKKKTLCGKVSKVSPYSLDDTLTEEGAAADAKAVGDSLNNVLTQAKRYTDSKIAELTATLNK